MPFIILPATSPWCACSPCYFSWLAVHATVPGMQSILLLLSCSPCYFSCHAVQVSSSVMQAMLLLLACSPCDCAWPAVHATAPDMLSMLLLLACSPHYFFRHAVHATASGIQSMLLLLAWSPCSAYTLHSVHYAPGMQLVHATPYSCSWHAVSPCYSLHIHYILYIMLLACS